MQRRVPRVPNLRRMPKRKRPSPLDILKDTVADFVCPITMSLPLEPVVAEDGYIYERSAISKWMQIRRCSPMTNLPIGSRLVAMPSLKDRFRTLISTNVLTGSMTDCWREKLANEDMVQTRVKRAEAGDACAMHDVASWRWHGANGLAQDDVLAFLWFHRAYKLGNPSATRDLGKCYLIGTGVDVCPTTGIALISLAAVKGDVLAMFSLGEYFSEGKHDVPVNESLAYAWYTRVAEHIKCSTCRILSPAQRTKVAEFLAARDAEDNK